MALHIYSAPSQPFTRYVDPTLKAMGFRRYVFRTHPRAQRVCHGCRRRRWAKHLRIQVYYDMVHIFCMDGCKRRRR